MANIRTPAAYERARRALCGECELLAVELRQKETHFKLTSGAYRLWRYIASSEMGVEIS